jgi:hypothetical protein
MKKPAELDPLRERPELDFSKGMRGKHAARYSQGTNVVLLDADLVEQFPDSTTVNRALRTMLRTDNQSR